MPQPPKQAPKKAASVEAKPAPKPEPKTPPSEKESEESEGVVDVAVLPVWSTLQIFLGILDRVAWLRMGIVVNPETQQIEKDFEQAKAAIDSYEAILRILESKLQPDAKRQFEARLTDLKLNYASHT